MRKERFPSRRQSKLDPRGDGLFQVLDRINAYKIELPGEYNVVQLPGEYNVVPHSIFLIFLLWM